MLTLLAVTLNDQPLSQPITARFDASGGTIGRADHNTMALPDPERHISRLQAEIVPHGTSFMIRNVGAANPIVVSGRALVQGESCLLSHADQVRIGGYLLKVDTQAEDTLAESARSRATLWPTSTSPVPPMAPPPSAPTPTPRPGPLLSPAPAPWAGPATSPAPPSAWLAAPPAAMPTPKPSPAVPPNGAPAPGGNPFADLLGGAPLAAGNPFADLLSPAAAPAAPPLSTPDRGQDPFADLMPPPAGIPSQSAAWAAPAAPAPRLPDDFDPFKAFAPPPPAAPRPPAPDPLEELGRAALPSSIDQAFGLGPATGNTDPLAQFMAELSATPSSAPGAGDLSTDPLALFGSPAGAGGGNGGARPADTSPPLPQPDNLPAVNAAFVPPRPRPQPAAGAWPAVAPTPPAPAAPPMQAAPPVLTDPIPAPPVPMPTAWRADAVATPPVGTVPPSTARPGSAADAALWAAFCQGAGVVLPQPADAAAVMHSIGRMMNSAVAGTLQLMAVRASTKHELRAAVTIIQPRSNNPLKFSPDAKAGIEQLVQPPARGFLDGPAAVDDAMHDLVGHSIGTVAGMRAAIEGMLDRFDPAALEAKLSGGGVLDSLLPASRKARLWDLYLQNHRAIRDEAQEDFHTLFGKAFLAAYEQQIERLKRPPAPPAP